jgi:hypothetical protein
MVAHVVMLRPQSTLSAGDREALLDAMRHAFSNIAEIRRVRIGRRVVLGRAYDAMMPQHFEYAAILEFDTEDALRSYLDHPAHVDLGRRFFQSAEAALVYDFVTVDPERVRDLLE